LRNGHVFLEIRINQSAGTLLADKTAANDSYNRTSKFVKDERVLYTQEGSSHPNLQKTRLRKTHLAGADWT